MPGQRKSIGPMAERLGVDSQKLQQFITDSPWEESAIWKAVRLLAADCLEPLAAWIVDETGWLKQGEHSVGVAHQYCGAAGKSAHCQVNVQVAITDGLVAVPVGAQLYLPESWTQDRARCREAGVPEIGRLDMRGPARPAFKSASSRGCSWSISASFIFPVNILLLNFLIWTLYMCQMMMAATARMASPP